MLKFSGLAFALLAFTAIASAEEPKPEPKLAAETKALFQKFESALNNVTLVGNFTMSGSEAGKLHEERYIITSVAKLPTGDLWLINARIKYGDKDLALPLPLEVKWAGGTPVITLDKVAIPGLGTFNARVVIDGDRYAGTWKHDAVGGHLFGRIEKNPEPKAAPPGEKK